jgi:hypothetical protein
MKRYAWAKYYEVSGKAKSSDGKKRKRSKATQAADNAQADFWNVNELLCLKFDEEQSFLYICR